MKRILLINVCLFFFSCFASGDYVDYLLLDPKKKISMDFERADLIDVLKIFSQQSGLNFLCAENIKNRKITVYFEKVPLKEAFESLLAANNLTYEFFPESNIFMVKELGKPEVELVTKVYNLKYTRVSTSPLQLEINSLISSTEEGSGEEGGEVQRSNYTVLKDAIMGVLSEHGKLVEDPRTNSLIVTDLPSRFPLVEKIINKLDVPTPQVMIEVEILDINATKIDNIGLDFSEEIFRVSGASRTTLFPFSPFFKRLFEASREAGQNKSTFTMGTLSFGNFQIILDFLTRLNDTKILARPRIRTLSNETAEIKITRDEAIGVKLNFDEDGSITSSEPEREETGISLRVTPQVNPFTGEITMFVIPKVADATDSTITLVTAAGPQDLKDVEERVTKAVLRVKDGETIVLTGLIRNDDVSRKRKVPFLGDLPFIGAAFRHKYEENVKRELVVFITPHVIWPSFHKKYALLEREQVIDEKRREEIHKALSKFEKSK